MSKRIRGASREGVPLIHRSMSVEVARALRNELNRVSKITNSYTVFEQEFPELVALWKDLENILDQLESGDVKRPC